MGLLDNFIDPETMAQLKAFNQPSDEDRAAARNAALMNAGFAMLMNNRGGNGRQAFGNALGAGGMAGMGAYQGTLDDAQQRRQQELQQGMQFSQLAEQLRQRKAQQAAIASLEPDFQQAIAAGVPYADIWKRQNPEAKLETLFDKDGREIKGYAKPDGSFVPVGGSKSTVQAVNLGGTTQFVDPLSMNGKTLKHTMTPGEIASNRLGWENLNLSRQNANAPTFNENAGGWLYKPTKDAPEGRVVTVPNLPGKPLTEVQGKATGFASRMAEAEKVINDPSTVEKPSAIENVAGAIPLVGDYAANASRSPDRQKYYQAQQDWVRAKLRLESGAVIGKDEMDSEIRTYFPQQGDSPEVIAQKAAARRTALDATAKQAGPQFKTPEAPKPRSKQVSLDDGSKIIASLGGDGNYYVTKGGKKYRVEE